MSFTDQKPHIATESDCKMPWSGGKNGKYFRCYLCGHRFVSGDTFRWVFAGPIKRMNFLTCQSCDGPDVLQRWDDVNKELESPKYWWTERS